MSDGPFFNSKPVTRTRRNKHSDFVDDETYLTLHWIEQEKVRRRYDSPYEKLDPGDFDNRIDNWEVGDEPEDKQ